MAQQQADLFQANVQDLLGRFRLDVNCLLGLEPRSEITLRKLPLWGKHVSENEVNFQWPSIELLKQMDRAVHLKSIKFKCYTNGLITSVRCHLSNSVSSPTFKQQGLDASYLQDTRMIEFDQSRPIR